LRTALKIGKPSGESSGKAPGRKAGRALAGLLCLVLAVFFTVEVAHNHAQIAVSAHCQLCAVAHQAIKVSPTTLASIVFLLFALLVPAQALAGHRPVLVTAFIRPPPASGH
jgi:hypothetical protein